MHATVRSVGSVNEVVLFVAFELAKRQWKLAVTSGFGVAAILRTVASGGLGWGGAGAGGGASALRPGAGNAGGELL